MGKRSRVSGTSSLIIYYILIINTCCDISLINCDIHEMRQQHVNRLADSAKVNSNEIDFKIDPIELQAHIMTGLNMTKTPDADLANISQEEFFSKYTEYLSRVNYRKRRSAKFYGSDVTNYVYGDERESVKKIFAFKHSNQSNRIRSQRVRRSTNEDEVTPLDFEIADREELPNDIEEATLNVFLTNGPDVPKEKSWKADPHVVSDSDSDYDDNSSMDAPPKITIKSHPSQRKSHSHRHRHQNGHNSNKNKVHIISSKQMIRLHVFQSDEQGRTLLLSKDVTMPVESSDAKFSYQKWIPLDLTSAVNKWLEGSEHTMSIDIQCEMCSKYGLSIVNHQDANQSGESKNNPALNIIGSVVRTKRKSGHRKHGQLDEAKDYTITKPKKTFCRQDGDKKCCRHKWEIDFQELGGYDYIIQPRNFDAGFCDGTCPYKYNVANNHAFFQSLARHQLHNSNIPNVCCAPTRLVDMEVLHIDENDHTRLKVTVMKKMKVMKCSCT